MLQNLLRLTPQGDYGQFQCDQPCCDSLFDNRSRVEQMHYPLAFRTNRYTTSERSIGQR